MAKIHHNTLKKAKAHGLSIVEDNGEFFVFPIGKEPPASGMAALAAAKDPRDALDLAITGSKPVKLKPKKAKAPKRRPRADDDEAEGDDGEGDDDKPSRSIIKAKYRTRYRPHKMTCGDDLAKKVRAEFMTKKDPDNGKPRLDFERFVAFAKANDCWVEGYRSLKDRHGNRNNGMIRMNVINRLRAKAEAGETIDWKV